MSEKLALKVHHVDSSIHGYFLEDFSISFPMCCLILIAAKLFRCDLSRIRRKVGFCKTKFGPHEFDVDSHYFLRLVLSYLSIPEFAMLEAHYAALAFHSKY